MIDAVLLGGSARMLEAGQSHTCALMDTDAVRCWGDDSREQIGNGAAGGPVVDPSDLGNLPIGGDAVGIGLGDFHTCALLASGQAKCWGAGNAGQLGYGDTADKDSPPAESIDLSGASAFLIAGGGEHSCAARNGSGVRCWGRGDAGQLGQGATDAILDPASSSDIQIVAP